MNLAAPETLVSQEITQPQSHIPDEDALGPSQYNSYPTPNRSGQSYEPNRRINNPIDEAAGLVRLHDVDDNQKSAPAHQMHPSSNEPFREIPEPQHIHGDGSSLIHRQKGSSPEAIALPSDLNPLLKFNLLHQPPTTHVQPDVSPSNYESSPHGLDNTVSGRNHHDLTGPSGEGYLLHDQPAYIEPRSLFPNEHPHDSIVNGDNPVTEPDPAEEEITTNSIEDILLPNSLTEQQCLPKHTQSCLPVIGTSSNSNNTHGSTLETGDTSPSNSPNNPVEFQSLAISDHNPKPSAGLSSINELGGIGAEAKPHPAPVFSQPTSANDSDKCGSIPSNTPQSPSLFPDDRARTIHPEDDLGDTDLNSTPIKEPIPSNAEMTGSIENTLLPSTQPNIDTILETMESPIVENDPNRSGILIGGQTSSGSSMVTETAPQQASLLKTDTSKFRQGDEVLSKDFQLDDQYTDSKVASQPPGDGVATTDVASHDTSKSTEPLDAPGHPTTSRVPPEEEICDVVPPVVNPLLNANDSELTMNPIIALNAAKELSTGTMLDTAPVERANEAKEDAPSELMTPRLLLTPLQETHENPLHQIGTSTELPNYCHEEIPLANTLREFDRVPVQHQFVPGLYPNLDSAQAYESGVDLGPLPEPKETGNQSMNTNGVSTEEELPIPDELQYVPGAYPDHTEAYPLHQDTLEEMMEDVRRNLAKSKEQQLTKSTERNEPVSAVDQFAQTFTVGSNEKTKLKKQENNQYIPEAEIAEKECLVTSQTLVSQPGLSNGSSSTLGESSEPNTHTHDDHDLPNPDESSSFIAMGDIVTGKIQSGLGTITRSRRLKERGKALEEEGKQVLEAKKRHSISW
ncbi:hypothetical protein K493DRAFT_336876 [Basidiobolus meristosporus CBS 931.73]|uniref:Uncharacterized protein n=1 Tax=Basidiobolus meristosporus CBS 931.73 TaxID=1314790 RepID=A0A1Y1YF14_9FUNG|nr:hypothetical protein K493DRAFT_336876 [Basidiobolus meristosporus CBS 931.73]|eukprot:ORX96523.1 hypothetical protein K493DRAFT_336876 [Basidiobolus meristosporus CBS 931.73]